MAQTTVQVQCVKPLNQEWRYRDCWVPGHGLFRVPERIVRIDQEDSQGPGLAGTHGWQVRYTRPWRLFSDNKPVPGRKLGSPLDSLRTATRYLEDCWRGPPARQLLPESEKKPVRTGVPGVRVVWRQREGSAMLECRVRVDDLQGRPLCAIYVGTNRTTTLERLTDAVHAGRVRRLAYLSGQNVRPTPTSEIDLSRALDPCFE